MTSKILSNAYLYKLTLTVTPSFEVWTAHYDGVIGRVPLTIMVCCDVYQIVTLT